MKIRCIFLALLIAAAASAAAQSREDVRIHIPLVVAVDPMQADFFQRNFAMEIAAAGYTVTENVTEADYSLRLRVRENSTGLSNGTPAPVPPGEDQYTLQITLLRNSDNSQIVSLSFGFSVLEEMYNHNLSLVYQTLANVPLTRSGDDKTLVKFMVGKDADRDDWWRNKWLYLRVSFDFPISYYQLQPAGLYEGAFAFDGPIENPARYSRVNHQIIPMPGITVGVEVQFLYWMSLETNFEMRFGDPVSLAFMPGIGVQLKFPFKPSTHFMLEPYAAGVASTNTENSSLAPFRYAIGGGLQLGVRGDRSGAFFFDANYLYFLNEVVTSNPDSLFTQPAALYWKRFVIGLSLGYKVGFGNRGAKREENTTWLFNNN
jgi:hypothetical protein